MNNANGKSAQVRRSWMRGKWRLFAVCIVQPIMLLILMQDEALPKSPSGSLQHQRVPRAPNLEEFIIIVDTTTP